MQPEVRTRLQHVIDAGEAILHFTAGRTFDEYHRDDMLRSAVERKFEIVGEALREAAKVSVTIRNDVTDYRRIVDFRNVLVHDYAEVYDEGVWRIITIHLPLLLTEVRALLASPDTGQNPA
jgi:uncharacterized protein with HEPN domain